MTFKNSILATIPDAFGRPRGKILNAAIRDPVSMGLCSGAFCFDHNNNPTLDNLVSAPYGFDNVEVFFNENSSFCSTRTVEWLPSRVEIGSLAPSHRLRYANVRSLFDNFDELSHGYDFKVGCELEFYLALNKNAHKSYEITNIFTNTNVFEDIIDAMEVFGIRWLEISQESGINQFEIALEPTDPLLQADWVYLLKILINICAARNGIDVLTTSVPDLALSPSSLHVNISGEREGQNIFGNGEFARVDELTVTHSLLGSIADYLDIYLPTDNCKTLFSSDVFVKPVLAAGIDDREKILRYRNFEKDKVLEFRLPTSESDTYRTIYVLLAKIVSDLNVHGIYSKAPMHYLDFDLENTLSNKVVRSYIKMREFFSEEYCVLLEQAYS